MYEVNQTYPVFHSHRQQVVEKAVYFLSINVPIACEKHRKKAFKYRDKKLWYRKGPSKLWLLSDGFYQAGRSSRNSYPMWVISIYLSVTFYSNISTGTNGRVNMR